MNGVNDLKGCNSAEKPVDLWEDSMCGRSKRVSRLIDMAMRSTQDIANILFDDDEALITNTEEVKCLRDEITEQEEMLKALNEMLIYIFKGLSGRDVE